ncbi:AraC family transcriptional regulator [Hirschia litorea]|uniref:AraC family transcriptional regulator N-terminal domain-containing protein n=1 Tax=Hirschia litorea TaxID=1199156 RepID=A0ABW2IIZ4_9PROT
MSKQYIKQLIERKTDQSGLIETGIQGVQLFRVTDSMRCAPAIYEPAAIAILSGEKEAILDGQHYVYDANQYMCCPITMPVEAGTPNASKTNPLLGVYISLDTKIMTELTMELERTSGTLRRPKSSAALPPSLTLSHWDAQFTDALLRLLQLTDSPEDTAILGRSRLRELYYAILKGDAGNAARRAFGVGNEIARTIEFISSRLDQNIDIEEMAERAGMSRAVFHRKFKHATAMSPLQFLKSMRLNSAAMKIASGMNISQAAIDVGYVSPSQFSREFKRLYGESPKDWNHVKHTHVM